MTYADTRWQTLGPDADVSYRQPSDSDLDRTESLASTIKALLIVQIATLVVTALADLQWEGLLSSDLSSDQPMALGGIRWYRYSSELGVVFLLALILTGITTMVWMFRMTRNGQKLAPGVGEHASHWCVTGWIVPILNLFRPKQMMDQVWATSRRVGESRPSGTSSPTTALWWGSFVACTMANLFSWRTPWDAPDVTSNPRKAIALVVAWILTTGSAVLFHRVISEVQARHTAALDNPLFAAPSPFPNRFDPSGPGSTPPTPGTGFAPSVLAPSGPPTSIPSPPMSPKHGTPAQTPAPPLHSQQFNQPT